MNTSASNEIIATSSKGKNRITAISIVKRQDDSRIRCLGTTSYILHELMANADPEKTCAVPDKLSC